MKEVDPRNLPDRGIYRLQWGNKTTYCRIQRTGRHQYIRYYADNEDLALNDSNWDILTGDVWNNDAWYLYDAERLPLATDPGFDRVVGPSYVSRRPQLFLLDDPDKGGIEV
jgi:hypothetical protein